LNRSTRSFSDVCRVRNVLGIAAFALVVVTGEVSVDEEDWFRDP
jgi:hypothetical protein